MMRSTRFATRPRRRGNRRKVRQEGRPHEGGFGRALRRGVMLLVSVAALVGAGVGVHYGLRMLRHSERLQVRSVEVVGNRRAARAELLAYTGLRERQNIFTIDLDSLALQLRKHPWVDTVSVRRRLPDTLVIEVREHTPAILVALGDVYLASAEGVLFKRVSAADGAVFPVLTGIGREQAAQEPEAVRARIREAVSLVEHARREADALGRVEEVHFDADLGWSLWVSGGELEAASTQVHLGFAPSARLGSAVRALAHLERLGHKPSVLWVDGEKAPHRIMARLRPRSAVQQELTLIAKAK